jgi:CelD/BcsL family acetyltransferase involved in cellulose biosynthesis
MNVSLLKPAELTSAQAARWTQLQRQSDSLSSPFYSPAFTLAAATFCPHVEVALIQQDGHEVGFFPFERYHGTNARPVAWKINDFQGGVFDKSLEVSAGCLLNSCHLSSWRFDHLPLDQQWAKDGCHLVAESPYVDLSQGFDHYLSCRTTEGGSRIKTILRKQRKSIRETGSSRFVFDCDEESVLESLLRWKDYHLEKQKQRNPLRKDWVRQLLRQLWADQHDGCRGTLSALFFDDNLAAVHFGLRNQHVLHWWFASYDPSLGRYSPGAILLLQLLRHAGQENIQRLDLGKGSEPYKRSFQSAAVPVGEGAVSRNGWRRAVDRASYGLRSFARLRFMS